MTETEFTELDLNKEVSDLEEDETKETLVDFMETHQKNTEAYDELQSEIEDVETDYQEQIEDYEEKLSGVKAEYAEEASEYVNVTKEIMLDRFSLDEIKQIIDEAEAEEEFSDEPDEEPEDETSSLTTFADRGEKGRRDPEDGPSKFRDKAESKLHQKMGLGR